MQPEKEKRTPTASAVLSTGKLVEMVYDPIEKKTQFICGDSEAWHFEESVSSSPTERLVPYSAENNLVKHGVVLFPSEPVEYGTEAELISRIRKFVHKYVDLSEDFEVMATYYALFTWIYDAWDEVPYVRFRGGYGVGKTRALLTLGSICYKPIFASAASTVSPLFRLLESFRGTLVIDEGDFRVSDEKAEVVKLLNNGNARGFPLLRTEVTRQKEFDPKAYHVFGPKVIATRGFFEDRALESRCLTEDLRGGAIRPEIPLNLDDSHREEARELRNQLLTYRLRNFHKARGSDGAGGRDLEPRLEQIFGPLVSVIHEPAARERVLALLEKYNRDLVDERSDSAEAQILTVIRDLVRRGPEEKLSVADITAEFVSRFGAEYERRVTPRWIGSILRRRLGLRPSRNTGSFTLGPEEVTKLAALYRRYALSEDDQKQATTAA